MTEGASSTKISRRRFLIYTAVGAGAMAAAGAGIVYLQRQQEEFHIEKDAIVACCGENCNICPNYKQELCDTCLATAPDAKLSDYCANQCQVRPCCHEKGIRNCAYCEDYACDKLKGVWEAQLDPRTKARLEAVRKSL